MSILQEKDRVEIQNRLKEMVHPVKIVNFTRKDHCEYCQQTRELLEEISRLSDKIELEVFDFEENKEIAQRYKIHNAPATAIEGETDYGIRFYGIPSGYEFVSLLEDILMVSRRDSGLAPETREKLAALSTPLHLQVFVTPTCPYCPAAVRLAHQFALENKNVVADMVEAFEFQELAQRYGVMGVPRTIANEKSAVEGALPEAAFLNNVLAAIEPA